MPGQYRPLLLLTRPEPASLRFADQARAAFGPEVDLLIAPLMQTVFYRPALPEWQPEGMIFTSETGVAGFAALESRRGAAICVGPRTAEAAAEHGWQAEVVGGDAEGLVRDLTARRLAGRWLHARGREAAGNLAGRLNAAGMAVTEAVVYAQDPLPLSAEAAEMLERCPERVVIPVFSPRSGRLLVDALPARAFPQLRLAVISEATARAVAPLSASAVAIAPTPDLDGMLSAISRLPGFTTKA
ncbi:uroporphyrinogen-III synthase [Falsigemmobacter faecalis]|uniref:Uroporphyrinogen-III synthase n=1 Tax=Falsigemmobacter faecalis TaxID=2488730 RepID=A0A3P3DSR1_9RHOB|nr:uroporphyrinogen-III synthase [Falsigemmobacter faecalis]RRH76572.1 uroporphyrinogen-III synthase [Falsigemmobacter faecalis]